MSEFSAAELARINAEKIKRRLALRQEYIKEISNPYNHASGQGGTLFDSALQRFQAVRVTHFEHFKPNIKTGRFAGLLVIGPILFYGFLMNKERTDREKKVRGGEVSYRDRRFRFI